MIRGNGINTNAFIYKERAYVNKIIFLQKNLEVHYDKLLFIFDWDGQMIEIPFEQNENHQNKQPKGKIQIRFDSIKKLIYFHAHIRRVRFKINLIMQ